MDGDAIDVGGPSSVRVIGIGGMGINVLGDLYMKDFDTSEFRRVNRADGPQLSCISTDAVHMSWSPVQTKIMMGSENDSAEDAASDAIAAFLDNGEIAFIVTELKEEEEIAASLDVAQICRKLGLVTVGIPIIPFERKESNIKADAQEALDRLSRMCDIMLMLDCDVLLKAPTMPSLNAAFEAIAGLVSGIIDNTLRMRHRLTHEEPHSHWAACKCIQ